MVLHFSLSSAFQWPDPEKRPILRPEVLRESAGVDDQTRISKASRSERCKGGSTTGDAGTLSSASSDAGRSSDWPASLPRELAPRELAEPSRPPPPAPADAPAARPVPGLGEGRRGAPAATASAGEEPTAAARTPLRRQAAAFVPAGAATAREPAAQGAQGQVASKKRTTVIMSNMPLSFTQEDLFVLLDSEGFLHKVDFLYLPINLTTMFGIGCAIVNLTTREHAKEFARVFDGFSDWGSESSPACRVRWSEVQGRAANMQRLQNSPVMSASVPSSCKPLLLEDGLLIPFPGPVQASCTELNKTRNLKTV
ncbi:unnamed protein product [Prorocentrum cordatum]|uniref:Mei2-like C-terminal RNA recognition motif domain-containing protein n=1 Tax=Prorocentrum cordatum TaxID=2364126 RepID=A0ABN9SD14_9DINO|nr:unnamed protein product [Polarella glacialis]